VDTPPTSRKEEFPSFGEIDEITMLKETIEELTYDNNRLKAALEATNEEGDDTAKQVFFFFFFSFFFPPSK
jgi:hypothetical protein